ncbi:MAG: HAMP domain-containing histidine kinase [Lachnospiraceae bacterium]
MGKKLMKNSYRKSIKRDFAFYIILYILSSLLLSLLCSELCLWKQNQIRQKYMREYKNKTEQIAPNGSIGQNFYNNDGIEIEIHYALNIFSLFTPFDKIKYNILGVASGVIYPLSFIVCLAVISILFYKIRLQTPLELLGAAADKITDNNLDFEIHYDRPDEFGHLCQSFEKMRCALRDNNLELWRQIEERKRLNAAFAHDLRTPLTVLKGQSEILVKYIPELPKEKIIDTAKMMQRHITRLENYVNTMHTLQRLEDIDIQKQPIDIETLFRQLQITGASVCTDKTFLWKQNIAKHSDKVYFSQEETINLDLSVIMQIYENLLSNAVRYAQNTIAVFIYITSEYFSITVSDDGAGFSARDLLEATKPFYKAAGKTESDHLGMGLNICKVLCEKHSGCLKLENKNGAVVTASFPIK